MVDIPVTSLPTKTTEHDAIPAGCSVCGARLFGICRALKSSELLRLSATTRRRRIAAGETIAFEADEVVEYANIVEGAVKLSKLLADGRQQIVGLQFAPEFIGKPFGKISSVSIEAATSVEICVFPKADFERMLKVEPDFEHRLLEQTLLQLDEARNWMMTLGRKTAIEKVASFLVLLTHHLGQHHDTSNRQFHLELPLTRSEIADFVGLTIETVSRQFTALQKDGLIRVQHNTQVTILDHNRLEARADGKS